METCPSNTSCDLLSNFLTHSYLNLLERYFHYLKNPSDEKSKQNLLQSLTSFLFILKTTPFSTNVLTKFIFSYYISYPKLTSFKALNHVSFAKLRKSYVKSRLKLASDDDYLSFNAHFVQSYYKILFSLFPDETSLSELLKADNAETFIIEAKKLRHILAKTPL